MGIREMFVDDLSKWWKMWSVWIFGLIGVLPDAYNAVATMGWIDEVPGAIKWPIRGLAAAGVILRLMRQRKPDIDEKAHS